MSAKIITLPKRLANECKAQAARENLVTSHMHVVEKIAKQVQRKMTHVPHDDLVADGVVGLVQAATRYTKSKGVFEHFAYFRIRGAMIDAHKRSAYRNETHESIDAIREKLGFMPSHLDRDNGLSPDTIAARREQARLLARAVDELDPDEKRVFVMALAGASLTKTAEECGQTVAWCRSKLAAARAQLGARVISWGVGLDKAA